MASNKTYTVWSLTTGNAVGEFTEAEFREFLDRRRAAGEDPTKDIGVSWSEEHNITDSELAELARRLRKRG